MHPYHLPQPTTYIYHLPQPAVLILDVIVRDMDAVVALQCHEGEGDRGEGVRRDLAEIELIRRPPRELGFRVYGQG